MSGQEDSGRKPSLGRKAIAQRQPLLCSWKAGLIQVEQQSSVGSSPSPRNISFNMRMFSMNSPGSSPNANVADARHSRDQPPRKTNESGNGRLDEVQELRVVCLCWPNT
jgi:hypothetical protein